MQVVKVPLGERSYSISIGQGILSKLGEECARLGLARRCAVVTDENVGPLHARRAVESLEASGFEPLVVLLAAGERSKSLHSVETCYHQLAGHRLERKSFLVALGGGVIGDLAGFVAATYLRGIAFVQAPTTLLAQVDSSVGGKVGVNLPEGKNLVGAFHQPKSVLCDLEVMETLPAREYRAGLAEVIKYGVIYDPRLFERLESNLPQLLEKNPKALGPVVARCCQIKAEVVSKDETETGLRAILNFGHTIGHALEAISKYGKFLHGEAISIGQVAAARLSAELLGCPVKDVERIASLLTESGLPSEVELTGRQVERLIEAMSLDKKVSGGKIKFILARRIGQAEHGCSVPLPLLTQILSSSGPSQSGRKLAKKK
jgi:3-dehydroquinate synthase